MTAGKYGHLFKMLTVSVLFVLTQVHASCGRTIVDLKGQNPLGTVIVREGKGIVLFSLGNGRAIQYSRQTSEFGDSQLLPIQNGTDEGGNTLVPANRRYLRWNK